MGRDFAKEAREGKLRSKISKLQQARMEEQAKAIQAMSPAERMALAKKNVPPPPPPPARREPQQPPPAGAPLRCRLVGRSAGATCCDFVVDQESIGTAVSRY